MKAPRFLLAIALSKCCESRSLLVRSREGGFVTRNCLKCGKPDYVSPAQLPTLECERCNGSLRVETRDDNYVYSCEQCDAHWVLAEALPPWSDLFSYCGLVAPGD